MSERHKIPRSAPPNQRPPHGKGWSRDKDGCMTVWRLWAPTPDGRLMGVNVFVTDIEMERAGRRVAAFYLRNARRQMWRALRLPAKSMPRDGASAA